MAIFEDNTEIYFLLGVVFGEAVIILIKKTSQKLKGAVSRSLATL